MFPPAAAILPAPIESAVEAKPSRVSCVGDQAPIRQQAPPELSSSVVTETVASVADPEVAAAVEIATKYAGYIGKQHDEVARAAGTIGYELMCALAPRVPVREADQLARNQAW